MTYCLISILSLATCVVRKVLHQLRPFINRSWYAENGNSEIKEYCNELFTYISKNSLCLRMFYFMCRYCPEEHYSKNEWNVHLHQLQHNYSWYALIQVCKINQYRLLSPVSQHLWKSFSFLSCLWSTDTHWLALLLNSFCCVAYKS